MFRLVFGATRMIYWFVAPLGVSEGEEPTMNTQATTTVDRNALEWVHVEREWLAAYLTDAPRDEATQVSYRHGQDGVWTRRMKATGLILPTTPEGTIRLQRGRKREVRLTRAAQFRVLLPVGLLADLPRDGIL